MLSNAVAPEPLVYHSGTKCAILGHFRAPPPFWPFWAILGHFGHFWPFLALFGPPGPPGAHFRARIPPPIPENIPAHIVDEKKNLRAHPRRKIFPPHTPRTMSAEHFPAAHSGMGGGIRARKWAPGGPGGPKRAKKGQKCPKWPKMAQNGQKGGGARKWPKMAHFVPEWYTSGSGATAFDSTGWQKSPEYALIRIAAGPLFPPGTKVADLPKWQKSPILAPPESRRFRPGWQKSPISPPSESGASSVARSLLEKLSARLSPSSQSLHGRLLTDSRGGRARVAHVTCATVTHAHAPHSLKTPVRVYDCAHPHTPHTSHPHTPHTLPTHTPTDTETQRHHSVTRASTEGADCAS